MEFNLTWDMYVRVAPLAPHIDLPIQQWAFDSKQWKFWDHTDVLIFHHLGLVLLYSSGVPNRLGNLRLVKTYKKAIFTHNEA